MDVSKRVLRFSVMSRLNKRQIMSIIASVIMPPLGLWLVWNGKWAKREKRWLSAMAAVCFLLMIGLMFWPGESYEGKIVYVERKPEVKVYGPELPAASVTGYIAPVSQPVFAAAEDEDTVYVYATVSEEYYHLTSCKRYYQSSQKLTPYMAYHMGYKVCPSCNPPAYVSPMQ